MPLKNVKNSLLKAERLEIELEDLNRVMNDLRQSCKGDKDALSLATDIHRAFNKAQENIEDLIEDLIDHLNGLDAFGDQ